MWKCTPNSLKRVGTLRSDIEGLDGHTAGNQGPLDVLYNVWEQGELIEENVAIFYAGGKWFSSPVYPDAWSITGEGYLKTHLFQPLDNREIVVAKAE